MSRRRSRDPVRLPGSSRLAIAIRTYANDAVPRRRAAAAAAAVATAAAAAVAFREYHGCVEPLPPSAVTVCTRVATHRRHFADRDGDHDDDDEDAARTLTLARR